MYLDGIGCSNPENATTQLKSSDYVNNHTDGRMEGHCIYLWMSDYHPDGGQLFFPNTPSTIKPQPHLGNRSEKSCDEVMFPMFVCLGKNTYGDNIRYKP